MDLFYNLSAQEIKILKEKITIIKKEFLRGEIIFEDDTLCSSIAIIKRGRVKAEKSYVDGRKTTIRILESKECIGISLIFSKNPFYKATFYSDTLTTIELITKSDLLKLMEYSSSFNQNVLQIISDHSIRLNERIKLLAYKTIRERLCYFLYLEYKKNNSTTFYINYTKTSMAELLNVERPSLSFELSKLIKENIIANKNKLYTIIDITKLISIL